VLREKDRSTRKAGVSDRLYLVSLKQNHGSAFCKPAILGIAFKSRVQKLKPKVLLLIC